MQQTAHAFVTTPQNPIGYPITTQLDATINSAFKVIRNSSDQQIIGKFIAVVSSQLLKVICRHKHPLKSKREGDFSEEPDITNDLGREVE